MAAVVLSAGSAAGQSRLKDIAQVQGLSEMQLVGFGVVVGLAGTGDGGNSSISSSAMINVLRNLGLDIDAKEIRSRNVAAVLVTTKLSPFARAGTRVDVSVSSMGDARSIAHGILLMTPLKGADDEIYATAQGPVGTGEGASGGVLAGRQQGNACGGNIPMGALVQKENPLSRLEHGPLRLLLDKPDFSTASAVAEVLRKDAPAGNAVVEDAGSIRWDIADPPGGRAALIARIENLMVKVSRAAKVVVNERTGTIVAGSDVHIAEVAVAHGNISVRIDSSLAAGKADTGKATAMDDSRVEMGHARVVPRNANVGELVKSMNSLGVSTRDLIAILEAIQRAGALDAELEIL
jgi:flagellar P-ring protein FlgI